MKPYPLLFEPILLEKVWGGDRLARLGKRVRPGQTIGESWELADLGATAASGAGGAPQRSVIANGPLRGRTLHEAIGLWRQAVLPGRSPDQFLDAAYPLLIKFLDARENLSVQVHPSREYARAHPECHLKTECWYVIEALPGSVIYKGVKSGVTRDRFRRAIEDGTVVDLLEVVPAVAGEMHNLPSGTVHALGAGVLVAEVQTASDTTFRVFDWGRTDRELHVEQAMDCIDFGPAPAAMAFDPSKPCGGVLRTDSFAVTQYNVGRLDGGVLPLAAHEACPFVVHAGEGVFEGSVESPRVRAGDTGLIPGGLPTGALLRSVSIEPLVVLVVSPLAAVTSVLA